MSFVFYDTETTGINTSFDQILQFGAIRTDHDLNEVDRFEIRCRLLPYVVPAPGAMRVTGVTVEQLTDPNLPTHYQMVRAIRAKLTEWSPAIFIGHNSIGFDEHLLRQALFKTLHTPYLTNTNGNCRSDSLRMIQAVAHLRPNLFSVPINEKGKPSFKLDRLAPANGFDHSDAHDAMADVEATIHMCKLLANHAGDDWSNFVRYAQKAAATGFVEDEEVFLLTDFFYGKPYSWFVTSIGPNPDYGSEYLVYDLSIDPNELVGLGSVDLQARLASRPKPVRRLRTNAAPILTAYDDAPTEIQHRAPDIKELRRRAEFLRANEGLRTQLIHSFLATREEKLPSPHVEEQIYDSFIANPDQHIMDQFHQVDWPARPALLGNLGDERLRRYGHRLLLEESPELLDVSSREAYETAIAERLVSTDPNVPWLTLPRALQDGSDLLASASGAEKKLLDDLQKFLVNWEKEALEKIT